MLYIFTKSTISAGGSRQRAFNVAKFLEKEGHHPVLVVPPAYRKDVSKKQARREYLRIIFSLRKGDIVLLQNPIFNRYFIFLMCLVKVIFRPTFIFDFDDATWVQNPLAPKIFAFFSDKVIVASHYLVKWPNIAKKPILLMPNLVDTDVSEKYGKEALAEKNEANGGKVVMGWIGGGPDSMGNLRMLGPILSKLAEKKLQCVFRLVGTLGSDEVKNFFRNTGIECEFVDALDWGRDGEIQKANALFDIGLCPLIPNVSNEARCSLKVLDYMAAKIPVVISSIGENNYFITDGIEGFLPKNEDEWVSRLEQLVKDASLRTKMGEKAWEKIQKEYSYQGNIKKYIEFLGLDSRTG